MINSFYLRPATVAAGFVFFVALLQSCVPETRDVELRQIKSVVGDITDEPTLKADVVFFNPNVQKGKLRKIEANVFVNGKKAAVVDQKLNIQVPGNAEFTVPLEMKINLEEQGLLNTLLSLVGAKKVKVRYQGSVRVIYKGLPVTVPFDREEEVRLKL